MDELIEDYIFEKCVEDENAVTKSSDIYTESGLDWNRNERP